MIRFGMITLVAKQRIMTVKKNDKIHLFSILSKELFLVSLHKLPHPQFHLKQWNENREKAQDFFLIIKDSTNFASSQNWLKEIGFTLSPETTRKADGIYRPLVFKTLDIRHWKSRIHEKSTIIIRRKFNKLKLTQLIQMVELVVKDV